MMHSETEKEGRKMGRKLLLLILTVLILSGCGSREQPPETQTPATEASEAIEAPALMLEGEEISREAKALRAEPGTDYEALMDVLRQMPALRVLGLPETDLRAEQIAGIREAFPKLKVGYTLEILGQICTQDTQELDLSGLTPELVAQTVELLPMLPQLARAELMDGEGKSSLSMTDVAALQDAAPGAMFHYEFELFGQRLSTADTEVRYVNRRVRDEWEPQIREALDILDRCELFVLDNSWTGNEIMAQIREDYRDRTKVVWRVFFGKNGSCLTDREVIRAVYGLNDSNCDALQYCEDAEYIDIGHDTELTTVHFVANMPKLKAIIVSGSAISDLTPFENCRELEFLEIAYCYGVADLSPLAKCESLRMLNISFTSVADLSPLDDLEMELMCAKTSKVPPEEQERFAALHPDCWSQFRGQQPYGRGWRYDENDMRLPYYDMLRDIFHYDDAKNTIW